VDNLILGLSPIVAFLKASFVSLALITVVSFSLLAFLDRVLKEGKQKTWICLVLRRSSYLLLAFTLAAVAPVLAEAISKGG